MDTRNLEESVPFGVFQKIKDYNAFRQVKVSFDTIEWSCGADLDPEYVYTKCKKTDLS